ncbi:MAG: DUF1549 domain-containing protein, partial [Acidobacteria bacterium]|nr:DUF1549 domain-containing protein [Acidobacteriota bacterium]
MRAVVLVVLATTAVTLGGTASVNCTFLRSPEEFLYSPERDRLEISARSKDLSEHLETFTRHTYPASADSIGARNLIDDYIFTRMEHAGIRSAPPISDIEFLRRVMLDLTGRIPSVEELESFLSDSNPEKRDRLIDDLIDSSEFVDKWTMFLGDLFKVNATASNILLYNQGRDAMASYVRDAVRRNKPYNQIATELITATGNNFYSGPANWVVSGTVDGPAQDTFDGQAVITASQFLGINTVDCLLCHDGARRLDSLNLWASRTRRIEMWGLAAFFAQTEMERTIASTQQVLYKSTVTNAPGEYWLNTTWGNRVSRQPLPGLIYVAPIYPFTSQTPEPGENRRVALARFITEDPQFARAIVNYVWEKIMVVAFVTPSNAFDLARLDPDNPPPAPWELQPANPELLNALGQWFRENGFDLRKLIALIVKSNAYQLSSLYPHEWKPEYVPYYARHYSRRLDAEEIHDAIVKATGIIPTYVMDYAGSLNPLPPVNWAMQFPDTREPRSNNGVSQFLNALGRGDRDVVPRSKGGSVAMSLSLMNNNFVMQR